MQSVKDHFGPDLSINAGDKGPDRAIRLIPAESFAHRRLHNRYFPGQILVQTWNLAEYLRTDVLLLDLNPRMPQVWIMLLCRRLLGKRTILWGHAWPRLGPDSRTDALRHLMRRAATSLVTYTNGQALALREKHPGKTITAAPNALYLEREFYFDPTSHRDSIIYVGRLHRSKKPADLVAAFENVHAKHPGLRLVIVGDGDEASSLLETIRKSPARERIELLGFIGDYPTLRRLYSRAIVSVSPGYVGLSITQSFSFGVPMLISRDEPHAPEVEAAVEFVNCMYFDTGQTRDLSFKLLDFVAKARDWQDAGHAISESCKALYSVERMTAGLVQALRKEQE